MLPSQPLISVITINYNDGDKLEKTIKSVIDQDYEFVEYIIVDGGSSDKSPSVINKYAGSISTIVSESDDGLYDAMNKGIKYATGDWVIFMNSGDYFYDLSVLSRIFSIEDRTKQNIIYGDREIRYDSFSRKQLATHVQKKLWKGMLFSHQSMFTRRKLLDENSFQYQLFPIASDFDLIYRLSRSETFYYCGLLIASIDVGGVSDTNRLQAIWERYKTLEHYCDHSFYKKAYYVYLILDSLLRSMLKNIIPKPLVALIIKMKRA
ncbi:MAG: glycosyltransferase [gamma proteobacterium symbiont of Bathyaustriella thionipta]|nr:glycosyltransferase [gamma proteobacterium symbiont of Bathyaustriella thionipta]MCU7949339.1 glycosyltransferase [gamma proteobacterium symbiont of Bathyaustriella thionipta]MCU7952659.1 glycosyltransferase [gamma proteobacterium symbiont of Bathyaustriella thionipta]MCU7955536.1 glycosyltransferase [gamma proteobacterium symbiont of Bathyaustriella thionipta]MCU7968588.1 glycosyltransferase [gamma proteobacterium symbiont of Bathyaustriella thionipta]